MAFRVGLSIPVRNSIDYIFEIDNKSSDAYIKLKTDEFCTQDWWLNQKMERLCVQFRF